MGLKHKRAGRPAISHTNPYKPALRMFSASADVDDRLFFFNLPDVMNDVLSGASSWTEDTRHAAHASWAQPLCKRKLLHVLASLDVITAQAVGDLLQVEKSQAYAYAAAARTCIKLFQLLDVT